LTREIDSWEAGKVLGIRHTAVRLLDPG